MSTTVLPTPEQEQRARWDCLLSDIEARTEQLRQLKPVEARTLMVAGITTGAAVFAAGAAFGLILLP
jgi:hypothetical protein